MSAAEAQQSATVDKLAGDATASPAETKPSDWKCPGDARDARLSVYNTITKSVVPFVPKNGNIVYWYICGPTVYDSSHMGHARSYLTFDIIRRILEDYFGYTVWSTMNITDVDDKIILRARRNHLFDTYLAEHPGAVTEETLAEMREAVAEFDFSTKRDDLETRLKQKPDAEVEAKLKLLNDQEAAVTGTLNDATVGTTSTRTVLESGKAIFSEYLDARLGSTVTDHSIFSKHSAYYEQEYMEDMEALSVRPPHALTRVSEYVDEIIAYTKQIIDNGFGYVSNNSVYFDTEKFAGSDHEYCKLKPTARGNTELNDEGEGALSQDHRGEKKSPNDFVLWKKSKDGEPRWESPWGEGRPGWHIECSAMAGDILGETCDIHGGGEDLMFPHHDNELAQAEAHFGIHQWVSYFLHAGHLHIEGAKMSKSLKNFVTIREALEVYSARQIRLLFLLHPWTSVLDYSKDTMREATHYEKLLREFFLNIQSSIHASERGDPAKWTTSDRELYQAYLTADGDIRAALANSFDTVRALDVIRTLIKQTNVYLSDGDNSAKEFILIAISGLVNKILAVFGLITSPTSPGEYPFLSEGGTDGDDGTNDKILPVLDALSAFRDRVRDIARSSNPVNKDLLELADELRDEVLPELGIRLEDKGDKALIKIDDRDTLLAEREERRAKAAQKAASKEANKRKEEERLAAKREKAQTKPEDLFKDDPAYSQFDDLGVPTHDAAGEPLSNKKQKKLKKAWEAQRKLREQVFGAEAGPAEPAN